MASSSMVSMDMERLWVRSDTDVVGVLLLLLLSFGGSLESADDAIPKSIVDRRPLGLRRDLLVVLLLVV